MSKPCVSELVGDSTSYDLLKCFYTPNVKCYRGNAVKAAHKRVKRTEQTQYVVQDASQACAFIHKSQLDYGCRNYTQLWKEENTKTVLICL